MHGSGETLTNSWPEVLQLRPLQDDGGIDIADPVAGIGRQFDRVLEKLQACGAFPGGIRVGKVHADIAQAKRSQKSIGDRVKKNVGVGMPGQAEIRGNHYSTQDQRPSGFGAMSVPPLPDSERGKVGILHLQESSSPADSSAR